MRLEFDRNKALFVIATFIFVVEIAGLSTYGVISRLMLALELLLSLLFIAYAICYLLYFGKKRPFGFLEPYFKPLFAAIVAVFIVQVIYVAFVIGANFYSISDEPTLILAELPVLLPPILLIFFARYLGTLRIPPNKRRTANMLSYILVAGAIAFVVFIYLSGIFGTTVSLDDEEFISIAAAHALVLGQNPYSISFTNPLYNYSITKNFSAGLTYTTNNLFEAGVDYPALSFLIFAPFAALSSMGLALSNWGVNTLNVILTLLVIFVIAFVVKPDALRRPPVAILIFLLAFFAVYATLIDFAMLAVALLAFYFIDNKYLWILLGIAASMQEQLWLVVILMLIYSFREHGMRRGSFNLAGTVLIFLLINGYFIAANPPAFLGQVFAPVSGYILPGPSAPIGFSVLAIYNTLLSSESILFVSAALISIILFTWLRDRRLIFLLALLPLMSLYHAILPYYTFFLLAVIVTLYIKDTPRSKDSRRLPSALSSGIALSCIAVLMLVTGLLMISSHSAFEKIGASVSGQSLLPPSLHSTLYNATLGYSSNALGQLALQEVVMYAHHAVPVAYGTQGERILIEPYYNFSSEGLSYEVNPNRIPLTGQAGSVNISVEIPSNSTTRVGLAECVIYGGPFYYICPAATAGRLLLRRPLLP